MMFGNQGADEWSSDEGEDMDLDDDDDDDEEYDEEDDYYDSEQEREMNNVNSRNSPKSKGDQCWEPQAKNYSHMNLKESIRNDRQSNDQQNDVDTLEAKKRLKNAKKRAEKRRKQKEKKQREANTQKSTDVTGSDGTSLAEEDSERLVHDISERNTR
jgi:hypothetical protein